MSEDRTPKMRLYHRYLGFFLAGIMAVYAISGITLIFRDTNFLKSDKLVERQLKPDIQRTLLRDTGTHPLELSIRDYHPLWSTFPGRSDESMAIMQIGRAHV